MIDPVFHVHALLGVSDDLTMSKLREYYVDTHLFMVYLAVGILYLPVIFGLQMLWKNKQPTNVKYIRLVHNIVFSLFSLIAGIELTPAMINSVSSSNFVFERIVCVGEYRYHVVSFWVVTFAGSKILELLESFYYIVEKKPLPFIHWYHHIITYIFSVSLFYIESPAAIIYTWMNLWVHAIMYFYYTLTSLGQRPSWAIFITISQIIQMFVGTAVTWTAISCEKKYVVENIFVY